MHPNLLLRPVWTGHWEPHLGAENGIVQNSNGQSRHCLLPFGTVGLSSIIENKKMLVGRYLTKMSVPPPRFLFVKSAGVRFAGRTVIRIPASLNTGMLEACLQRGRDRLITLAQVEHSPTKSVLSSQCYSAAWRGGLRKQHHKSSWRRRDRKRPRCEWRWKVLVSCVTVNRHCVKNIVLLLCWSFVMKSRCFHKIQSCVFNRLVTQNIHTYKVKV